MLFWVFVVYCRLDAALRRLRMSLGKVKHEYEDTYVYVNGFIAASILTWDIMAFFGSMNNEATQNLSPYKSGDWDVERQWLGYVIACITSLSICILLSAAPLILLVLYEQTSIEYLVADIHRIPEKQTLMPDRINGPRLADRFVGAMGEEELGTKGQGMNHETGSCRNSPEPLSHVDIEYDWETIEKEDADVWHSTERVQIAGAKP